MNLLQIISGIVPDVFKISRVTPINNYYKSGEVNDTGKYRAITTIFHNLVKCCAVFRKR